MLFIKEFAQFVADRVQELTYLPSEDGGNVFVDKLPDGGQFENVPIVCVTWRGGATVYPTSLTENAVEIRVRGGERRNSVDALTLAAEIRRQLHGWLRARNRSYVGSILKVEVAGPPQSVGYDEKDRSECVLTCMVHSCDPVADEGVAIWQ